MAADPQPCTPLNHRFVADQVYTGSAQSLSDIAKPLVQIRLAFETIAEAIHVDPGRREAVIKHLNNASFEALMPNPDGARLVQCLEAARVLLARIDLTTKIVDSLDQMVSDITSLTEAAA